MCEQRCILTEPQGNSHFSLGGMEGRFILLIVLLGDLANQGRFLHEHFLR
ncbi:Uncharacterised protein [Zhongshania aliphaticivorans]|uniref:Uncharacterized protein n=1 Tax=Zhongshania aliphaticivorans TaxID=1470434 RepID=A0A5S9MR91_9GAMM|nr:Uncharacterised protein [Zhongshania aliphaticivorans]CAA0086238.1 Uncharacterised protein [Zhongshania aliphaticivorans]